MWLNRLGALQLSIIVLLGIASSQSQPVWTKFLFSNLAWAGFLGTLTLISLATSLLLLAETSDIWDLGTALVHFGILAAIAEKFGEQTINAVMIPVWGLLYMLLHRSPKLLTFAIRRHAV